MFYVSIEHSSNIVLHTKKSIILSDKFISGYRARIELSFDIKVK